MTKRLALTIFIFLLFLGTFILFKAIKTAEIYVTVYYPGELEAEGYSLENNQIVLKFHFLTSSGDLKKHFEKFKVRCFFCDLDLEKAKVVVNVDGTPLYPTCRDYVMSFDSEGNGEGVHYIASPYNLTSIAEVRIPEGYVFKELNFENNTLTIFISPGDDGGVEVVKSDIIAEYQEGLKEEWIKIVYIDGSKEWEGRVQTIGREGECPILIQV
ncbi:hypothetical protein NF865_07580 [Thermococcus aggregans]|uniref:Uncharacterized protein n=1 Tax=Thermococcus aggregans TaxID=110163 RepID=A0A9E7MWG6_THEAG|nr:hypothetical protein [Thermococcus aggregans]USS40186.1 hypothetical protein NF865_07580 [Thermococcus aggregans]